ncbi:hypothetical protein [Verrucomicrobium spinosum]|uniref:hypothetical protein n=1 Tax=Verrucomicrobium spinosum TaxID=2736 RepID=UPI0009466F4A|nr:hypothetical protein [Verrucomicrobium spinosum]
MNSGSFLNYDLGTASDLLTVNGALTLNGTARITMGTGFGAGTYKLVDYTGTLTDNGLVAQVRVGYNFAIQVDTANTDINLVVTQVAGQYWDGGDSAADNTVDGGSGVWTNAGTNWTSVNGSANGTWRMPPTRWPSSPGRRAARWRCRTRWQSPACSLHKTTR